MLNGIVKNYVLQPIPRKNTLRTVRGNPKIGNRVNT